MTAQDRSLQQYQQLLQLNAASHLLRIARQIGLFDVLAQGQRTAEQLIESLELQPVMARRFFDALLATGAIERYGEDYALAQVTRLLCQYDADLGDAVWEQLAVALKSDTGRDADRYRDTQAATQWIHTRTAMEAAEMLNIGEDRQAPRIVDVACGSAVWSCTMAYRDAGSTLTAVDHAPGLQAATSTAQAIELGNRFTKIEGDPRTVELPAKAFDIAVLAQRLHSESMEQGSALLERIHASLDDGGEIVVIDLFQTPEQARLKLSEAIEALKMELGTEAGAVRRAEDTQQQLLAAGFRTPQFSYLPASTINMGMLVARKGP